MPSRDAAEEHEEAEDAWLGAKSNILSGANAQTGQMLKNPAGKISFVTVRLPS
jgi:hypothetical protein